MADTARVRGLLRSCRLLCMFKQFWGCDGMCAHATQADDNYVCVFSMCGDRLVRVTVCVPQASGAEATGVVAAVVVVAGAIRLASASALFDECWWCCVQHAAGGLLLLLEWLTCVG